MDEPRSAAEAIEAVGHDAGDVPTPSGLKERGARGALAEREFLAAHAVVDELAERPALEFRAPSGVLELSTDALLLALLVR